jgi:hypothetical protein
LDDLDFLRADFLEDFFLAAGFDRLTAARFLTVFFTALFFDDLAAFFGLNDFRAAAFFFFFAIPIPPMSSATPLQRRVDLHLA